MDSTKAFVARNPAFIVQLSETPRLAPIVPCTSSQGNPPTPVRFLTLIVVQTEFAIFLPYAGRTDGSPQEEGWPRSCEYVLNKLRCVAEPLMYDQVPSLR